MALAWNPKQSFDIEKKKSKMERSKIDKKKKRLVEFVVILNVKHKPSLK